MHAQHVSNVNLRCDVYEVTRIFLTFVTFEILCYALNFVCRNVGHWILHIERHVQNKTDGTDRQTKLCQRFYCCCHVRCFKLNHVQKIVRIVVSRAHIPCPLAQSSLHRSASVAQVGHRCKLHESATWFTWQAHWSRNPYIKRIFRSLSSFAFLFRAKPNIFNLCVICGQKRKSAAFWPVSHFFFFTNRKYREYYSSTVSPITMKIKQIHTLFFIHSNIHKSSRAREREKNAHIHQ